jgi:hypothetical protein
MLVAAGDPSTFEQLLYQEDGPVAQITLNRPQRRNALSMQLSEELIAALTGAVNGAWQATTASPHTPSSIMCTSARRARRLDQ